jgi:GrpB-like predicted nucleotidyltransferase (UPF0157 family)
MIGLERNVVRLTPYNPAWKALYEIEKRRILEVVGKVILDIQHVGSTALPGGAAKPIIDIAIAVESYEKAFASVEPIVELGYEYLGENGVPRRHYFVKRDPRSTHHIHMNELHSQDWENQILFRDYLLAHPELVQEYTRLKLRLADQFSSDRLAYAEGKAPFIEHVLQLARAELSSDQEEASAQNGEK